MRSCTTSELMAWLAEYSQPLCWLHGVNVPVCDHFCQLLQCVMCVEMTYQC